MTERVTATTTPYTIGRPPFRPGDEADFGGKFKEQPGDLNRPDPLVLLGSRHRGSRRRPRPGAQR